LSNISEIVKQKSYSKRNGYKRLKSDFDEIGMDEPSEGKDDASSYVLSYDAVAQVVREAMIAQTSDDIGHQKQNLQAVFDRIDANGSGVMTSHELRAFLSSPELGLFQSQDQAKCKKFTELLIEQIDVDR
jgi:hypothetical protein